MEAENHQGGLRRDQVRLMVSHYNSDTFIHTRFDKLTDYLTPGDVLVINASATLKAALRAWRQDGSEVELHLSTRLPADLWIVELRQASGKGNEPIQSSVAGAAQLQVGGRVTCSFLMI
jgi:S-adenosylmethionine:tRNA ribosyltransferase-isomerase